MTKPPASPSPSPAEEPAHADRVYRSPMAVVSGVLLLALLLWLCGDAVVRGAGNTPWFGLAVLLLAAPLVVAFTVRPAVFANEDRMRVRNPFRIVDLPWAAVDAVRSGYSAEVLAEGSKYQLWSIPVSLRERKRAGQRLSRREALSGRGTAAPKRASDAMRAAAESDERTRARADRQVDELRELAESCADRAGAAGSVSVRWAYEIIAPAVAGAVLLVALVATR
ncbi:PH domain-containing protein [Streptomyces sp. BI20]|uniref:PH domain-containing protein n=1 Tax=Streptomyces sp. BI20 TaxID=3403460 RepID=UPI003C792721